MGWLRKKTKQIGRAIKKVGKKIGKAFKKVLKPFAKVFGKLGPLGSIAMMMILPGIGQMLAGWGANMGGMIGSAIQFTGNAINYVATAPQKIFGTITDALGASWNTLTGSASGTWKPGSWFDNFSKQMTERSGTASSWGTFDVSAAGQKDIAFLKTKFGGLGPEAAPGGVPEFSTDLPLEDLKPDLDLNVEATQPKFDATTGEVTGGTIQDASRAATSPSSTFTPSEGEATGVFGKARKGIADATKSLSSKKIPGVGTVGDVAWAGSTGISAFNAYNTFAGGTDLELGGAGDLGYQASNLLGPTTDQGGIYNMSAPTWSYDSSLSFAQNQNNAINSWNSNYGLPQGFDPMGTPGYGWNYQQWLQQQMAA